MNIVPEDSGRRNRSRLFDALLGAGLGAAIATVAWLVSGEYAWFFAIPVIALLAVLSPGDRPRTIRARNQGK